MLIGRGVTPRSEHLGAPSVVGGHPLHIQNDISVVASLIG